MIEALIVYLITALLFGALFYLVEWRSSMEWHDWAALVAVALGWPIVLIYIMIA